MIFLPRIGLEQAGRLVLENDFADDVNVSSKGLIGEVSLREPVG